MSGVIKYWGLTIEEISSMISLFTIIILAAFVLPQDLRGVFSALFCKELFHSQLNNK